MTAFQHGHDNTEQPSSGPRDDDLASVAAACQSLVFERSHDAILIAGSDGRYVDANPAALTLLGYEREELLGRHFTDVVPPGPSWTAETYDRFVSGGAWEGEVDVRTKAGGLTPTSARTVVLSGDHAGVHVTMLRDLSDRNASEVTRSRLAAIVRSSADAIIGEALDATITDWNPAAERLYGYSAEEVIGHHVFMLAPPEQSAEVAQRVARVRTGESITGVEVERRTKDGRRLDVSLTVSPVYNDANQIVATSAIVRDISARKAAEAALAASETRFRTAFANAPIGMALVTPDGRILQANAAVCAMLGYTDSELHGTHFQEITHPDDLEPNLVLIESALAGDCDTYDLENRYIRKDGQHVWAHLRASLVRDDDGTPHSLIAQIQDITERKRAEEELRAALAAAHAANHATRQFLAMMSHELRTPMQAVMGYSELLLAGSADSLTPDQTEDVRCIHRGAVRLVGLVTQTLELSRLEAGQMELTVTPVALAPILAEVRRDIAPQALAKGVDLHIDLPPELPPVLGDEMGIYQILLNLVGNAVKFTEAGEVRISAETTESEVVVAVRDTGIGIAPESLPHIFEEFRQVESGMTRRYSGTGLGLAIASRLAALMGGRLSVKSQEGVGSTFTLYLCTGR